MTIKQRNALRWLVDQGYVPVLGGLRFLDAIELKNKDTGEIEKFSINVVVSEYEQWLKDERRARAAERRLEKR